jgi:hypothetical protein
VPLARQIRPIRADIVWTTIVPDRPSSETHDDFLSMKQCAIFVGLAVALVACSSDPSASNTDGGFDASLDTDAAPPPVPEWRAGSRLHPIVTTNGVVKAWSGFHDNTFDNDCSFMMLEDGALHCAPLAAGGSVYYTDAACTQPVMGYSTLCPHDSPKYARSTDYVGGCSANRVVELGAATTPASIFSKTGKGCAAYSGPALSYQQVTRTVAPSEMVSGTVSRQNRGPQLAMTYIDGEDGSRQPYGIEDATRKGTCIASTANDATLRCLPSVVAYVGPFFGDSACTTIAAFKPGYADSCNVAPTAVQELLSTACGFSPTFFEPGPKVAGPVYQSASTCDLYVPSATDIDSFYGKGAPIADGSFAALHWVPTSESPLALNRLTVASGESVGRPGFWDAVHHTQCIPTLAADGKTRCIPSGARATYSDSGCTQPILAQTQLPMCTTLTVPTFLNELIVDAACGPFKNRVYGVGAKIPTPNVYYAGSPGKCQDAGSTKNMDFYASTPEITATEWVELTNVVE